MALLETLHRADTKLQRSLRDIELEPEPEKESKFKSFFGKVAENVSSGASTLATPISTGVGKLQDSFSSTANDVAQFFRSISVSGSKRSAGAESSAASASAGEGAGTSAPSAADSRVSSMTDRGEDESFSQRKDGHGVYGVDYSKYPISAYVKLPVALQPFVNLPGLDHYLVVAKPTMDKSAGLDGYRDKVPKEVRASAPFLIIVDEAGKGDYQDKSYLWFEFKLVDVFKLDVRPMKKFDDFLAKLSKKGRWNCKDRIKKLKGSPLKMEYGPLPRDKASLDELLPLYKQTGEKNGFCVLGEQEFYEFHTNTPDLTLLTIRDTSQGGKIVTFCTGVRSGDVLMPMWCGTDYDNELAMKASTYYNMLYEYFRIAIEDPTINWVDLGATRRQAKLAIGCDAYPVSGYVRCKNSIMVAIVETMMKEYFKPEELMNDP